MSNFMVRWLKLSLVVIVGCGFLAMMIYALVNRDEISTSQVEPPLITPPSEPLKRRPDQPGGMQIPNRDKLVFDLLDSSNTVLGDTGEGMPAVATPSPSANVTGAVVTEVSDSVAAVEAVGMDVETTSSSLPEQKPVVVPQVVAPKPVVAVSPVVARIAEPKPVTVVPVAPKVEEKPVAAKSVEKPVVKVAEKQPVKTDVKVEAKTVNGKWAVQLAAVNSIADGNALTAKASKDFPALHGLTPRVTAVPNVKKFRVQFVGLKDRDAAAAVCAKLAGKQPCFPVNLQ